MIIRHLKSENINYEDEKTKEGNIYRIKVKNKCLLSPYSNTDYFFNECRMLVFMMHHLRFNKKETALDDYDRINKELTSNYKEVANNPESAICFCENGVINLFMSEENNEYCVGLFYSNRRKTKTK
jgi:hypothetical protein